MEIEPGKLYGVLTGDVVASSRLDSDIRRNLHDAMIETSRALRKAFEAVSADVDVFRGDSWQMVLSEPALTLRAGLFYRAGLRARMTSHRFDIRMAMAIGTIDFIPGERVSEGDGEAFRLSGRSLEALEKGRTMGFASPRLRDEPALDIVVRLVDALAARWSDRQALAVTGALQGWTQEHTARVLWERPVSQQAIAQHLDRAAWNSLEAALYFFEQTATGSCERPSGELMKEVRE